VRHKRQGHFGPCHVLMMNYAGKDMSDSSEVTEALYR
jgi:hypothetical protein